MRVWGANNSAGLLGNSSNNQVNSPIAINCPTTLDNETFDQKTVSIFPNPASQSITFTTNDTTSTIDQISIYDSLGKEIFRANNCPTTINIEALETGIYFINFTIGDTLSVKKLIKN